MRLTANKTANNPLETEIDILLRDRFYNPAKTTTAQLKITPLDRKGEASLLDFNTDTNGNASTRYVAERPGYYRVEPLGEPWARLSKPVTMFLGGSQTELRNLDLTPETLQRLSTTTHGKFFANLGSFKATHMANSKRQTRTIIETQRLKLRNWIWSLPLLILIACLEWLLRRSRHLA